MKTFKGNQLSSGPIRKKLEQFLSDEEIREWLEQPHFLLSNSSPSDFIRAGRDNDVLRLIDLVFDKNVFQKMTAPIEISLTINNARREAAKIYAAYFAGAPVHTEIEVVERRLIEVITPLYRKNLGKNLTGGI